MGKRSIRRDHVVPRFYLEGFTAVPPRRRKPSLLVFDRQRGTTYTRTPEEVWRLANYYDTKDQSGRSTNILDVINKEIEDATAPLLREGGFLAARRWPSDEERARSAPGSRAAG